MHYDIQAELERAVARVGQIHLDWLVGLGVPKSAIAKIGATQAPFGVASVEFLKGSYWQPRQGPGSIAAIVQPVFEDGVLIDLLAWRSLKPTDWHWRLGEAWALGSDSLRGSPWDGFASIQVHATPLAWLASGGEGLVVLNWFAPDIRRLSLFDELICTDDRVADKLERLLSRPARVPVVKRGTRYATG